MPAGPDEFRDQVYASADLTVVEEPRSPVSATTPASARLGSEGLARLRARHAEVLARITEKITDPVRHAQLNADAERLNPDTWVTAAEVVEALETYEAVFETLRGVIGHRRPSRRRRPGGPDQPAAAAATPEIEDAADPNEPAGDL